MADALDLPTHPDFARQIEQCEVDAWMDLVRSTPEARQFEFVAMDGVVLMIDRAQNWPHSRILNLGATRPATRDLIAKVLDTLKIAGIGQVTVDVSPIARPGSIGRLLTQAGFQQTARNVIVARHTGAMDEPDGYFRIRAAETSDDEAVLGLLCDVMGAAPDWCRLLVDQIARSQWRFFLAWEGNHACALAGYHFKDHIAWLAPIWTRDGYRNRGTQAAMISHAVRAAASDGVEWMTTSYPAIEPGRTRNFERLGFSMVYQRNHFVWPAGSQS